MDQNLFSSQGVASGTTLQEGDFAYDYLGLSYYWNDPDNDGDGANGGSGDNDNIVNPGEFGNLYLTLENIMPWPEGQDINFRIDSPTFANNFTVNADTGNIAIGFPTATFPTGTGP